ncbi:hypothetical protein PR202_gb26413 [Eleusine coracana subsp. coracana]|uniref:DUF674 family protein n=1 Tax=Eleusine coracana subsp. coracana TaxID=191504 RepID=A0AAV5FT73_ELECO|nr:hypothetical protein PR202_gb26413 [Eleusine coracana subsp. coracana]
MRWSRLNRLEPSLPVLSSDLPRRPRGGNLRWVRTAVLYEPVEKLDSTYVQAGAAKEALLCPTVVSPTATTNSNSLLGLPPPPSGQQKTLYRCTYGSSSSSSCRTYITDVYGKACPACGCQMVTAAQYVTSAGSGASGTAVQQSTGGKGFVQGIVTYTVLDNLTISPMSAISSITLLNTFEVTDLAALQEKNVLLGYKEKLDAAYVQPGVAKDTLLRPTTLSPSVTTRSSLFRLPAPTPAPTPAASPKKFFRCNNGDRCNCQDGYYGNRHASFHNYVSDTRGTTCPSCGGQMNTEVEFVLPAGSAPPPVEKASSAGGKKGFVQGIVTYTVLDNLTITPMSAISSITLLNTFEVTDLAALQEKTVQLGYDEGLQILKASLFHSKTVLTDVFHRNKAAGSSGDA